MEMFRKKEFRREAGVLVLLKAEKETLRGGPPLKG